ncbi:MAG: hypothetical protein ABIQ30_12390 [Devosia sp.]
MTSFRTILIMMAAAASVSLAAAVPAHAQAEREKSCLSDQQIQSAIESGDIKSWPKIKKMAGISSYEEVSDVKVCKIGDTLFYILNVVSPEGEATKIVLNAVDGTKEVL